MHFLFVFMLESVQCVPTLGEGWFALGTGSIFSGAVCSTLVLDLSHLILRNDLYSIGFGSTVELVIRVRSCPWGSAIFHYSTQQFIRPSALVHS